MTAQEQLTDLAKVAPPITITSLTIAGIPVSEWLLLLTAIYTILQIILVIRRLVASRQPGKNTCYADCPVRRTDE